jgi:hypothetical protein
MFDKNAVWKFDEIVPEDNVAKMEIANKGLELGTITRGQWKKIATSCGVTLPPDNYHDDMYLMGLMTQEIPANAPTPEPELPAPTPETPPPAPEPPEPEKSLDLDAVIKELNVMNAKMTPVVKSSFSEAQKVAIWKSFDKRATATEGLFVKAVRKFSGVQSARVTGEIKTVKTVDDIATSLDAVFTKESDAALKRSLAPAWLESMKSGRAQAESLIAKKAATVESVTNELFNKWVESHGLEKAKEINDTTHKALLKKLQAAMAASIDAGDGLAATVDKLLIEVDGVYDNMDKARAVIVARTESCASLNYGTQITYSAEGVEKKEFLAVRDGRTREDHAGADGQIVGINDPFNVGGEKMMYPGDPNCSAFNVVNCRCTIAGVFDE